MCLPYLFIQQREVGYSIINYGTEIFRKVSHDEIKEMDRLWRKFYHITQQLRSAGIQDDIFYYEVQKGFIKFCTYSQTMEKLPCDCTDDEKQNGKLTPFVEIVKKFLHKMENCVCADVKEQELQLIYELLKENFKSAAAANDGKSQEEFDKLITIYFDMLTQLNRQMYKRDKEVKHIGMPETDNKPPVAPDNADLNEKDIALPTAENNEALRFDNYVDKILDHPTVNCLDVENITLLMDSTASCLNVLTKMDLNTEATKLFIARTIIRKFSKETLQEYQSHTKQPNYDQTLEDVLDFLGHKILESQNGQKSTSIQPKLLEKTWMDDGEYKDLLLYLDFLWHKKMTNKSQM